jgi:RNA polymerase sigma-70 factor, ECF subfamily
MGAMDGFDPDIELMLRVRDGDADSFNAILRKYQRPIVNYIYRCLNHLDEAEELAQEVFLRVYMARHRYEPTAKLSSWIYKIATNLCLKELQRKRRMPVADPVMPAEENAESPVERVADIRPTVLEDMEVTERERLISDAIQELPANEKTALLLRKYHELPYKEIAQAMGCTEGAVKTYLHRGKLRLREKLLPYLTGGAV